LPALPTRPLGFGELLDLSFQVYRRDFLDYTLIAAAGQAPAHALVGLGLLTIEPLAVGQPLGPGQLSSAFIGTGIAALIFSAIAWTALASAIAGRIKAGDADQDGPGDGGPGFGASYRLALRRLPAFLAAGVLAALLLTVVFFVPAFVSVLAGMLMGSFVVGVALTIFCTLAGFVWWISSVFGLLPAVVVEGCGPVGALRRSFALARGGRFRIFGTLAVVGVMLALPDLALQSFAYGVSSVFAAEPAGVVSSAKYWGVSTGSFVLSSVTTPLMVSCVMLVHYDRRVRREGYDLEAAAASLAATAPRAGTGAGAGAASHGDRS